ncbi:MAG: response regulator [Thermodesulfobacteriota bacterium]
MSEGLDVIIVDDDEAACESLAEIIGRFYSWGNVYVFTDDEEAGVYCLNRNTGIAIFVVDVFLKDKSGFMFLDSIAGKYEALYEDTIIVTGHSNDDIVDMCVAAGIHHLLEKPIRAHALQLAVRSIAFKYLRFADRLLNSHAFHDHYYKLLDATRSWKQPGKEAPRNCR